ncbi:DegT/DnrJ/EryC1/StrS family aminotransferase [Desulfatitalea tepidiphila]|uniref:DegT/DnrJ/EryC1/StrS family aminotransferase n=1 Tax=Desulfatitalea tepidiphila TaxID=1185843 RepID=UPI0013792D43|nr:DegT/DnrJ/EryC1/StrS family aminotransferase [Desulfatitalea tepidiphila]
MSTSVYSRLQRYPPAESKIPLTVFFQSTKCNSADAEQALCQAMGTTYCLLGPSGRALLCRLLVGLSEKDPGQRNEVLMPAYTCYSVAAAVAKAKLKIRLYDLHPQTFAPVTDSVSKNLGRNTLAVITQHLLGVPTDVSTVGQMARETGAWHIEDAAQALGGDLNGKPIGAIGDFGLLSFGRGKPLPLGGGGALISRRFNPAQIVSGIRKGTGWKTILASFITQPAAHPLLYGLAEALPLGLGQTEFNAGFPVGRTPTALMKLIKPMMATLPQLNHHRRTIAAIYQREIPARHLVSLQETCTPVFPRFPVLGRAGRLTARLRQLGVRRLYPHALHQEPEIMAFAVDTSQQCDGAAILGQQLITLPTHHAIGADMARKIARNVSRWIKGD